MDIVACLSSEDGRLRCDSPPIDAEPHVEWVGSTADPIILLDNFNLCNEILCLSFRLCTLQGQVALCKIEVVSNTLVYHGEGSPRKKSLHRDSIHGSEGCGITDKLPITTLVIDNVTLHYVASQYQEHHQKFGTLAIVRLQLSCPIAIPQDGHKLVCIVNQSYLGRAQEIETVKSKRVHRWIAQDADHIGLVPYLGCNLHKMSANNSSDLKYICAMTPPTEPIAIPDNDAYTNLHRKLPFTIKANETVEVSLFNLRPNAKMHHATFTLTWDDFLNVTPLPVTPRRAVFKRTKNSPRVQMRGNLTRNVTEDVSCTLWFTIGVDQCEVYTIILSASKFAKSLLF